MKPVIWGILSTAKIGMEKVIPAMLTSPELEVRAIASRDGGKAKRAAKQLGIATAYDSYEKLLADPAIEAIYNPLPNHLHVPLTLAAAKAGKHILCEKPIALNAREAAKLRKAPKGVLVAEAFMVRHNPQWLEARARVRRGEIGTPRAIQVFFSYYNVDPVNVRNIAKIGGGGLLDIGCYPITGSRFIFEAEPKRVIALIDRDPKFKTDRTASAIADFGDGRQLTFTVSTQSAPHQRVNIVGTKGRIEIEIPFNAPPDRPNRYSVFGTRTEVIDLPITDQYRLQAEAFGRVIRGKEKLVWGIEDAIQNMKILDALFRSEKSRKWEKP
jgi:predicted dehydrogenase